MKKIRLFSIFIAISLILVLAITGCATTKNPAKKEAPKNNTTNATTNFMKDNWPNGCLTCHKQGDKYSLSEEIKRIKNHPNVNVSGVKDCYTCHGKTSASWAKLVNSLHKTHLKPDSKFITKSNANCIACHKFNKDNGEIVLKGLEGVQRPQQGTGTSGTQSGTTSTPTPGQ